MKTERMNAVAALEAIGIDTREKGAIKARVLVRDGASLKRYTCRLCKGTGHVLYRWGRLGHADVTNHGSAGKIAVFHPVA